MKVCKFEKIKNEEEIIRIIDCIRNEHPHVLVIPTAIHLQKWLQKISSAGFTMKTKLHILLSIQYKNITIH